MLQIRFNKFVKICANIFISLIIMPCAISQQSTGSQFAQDAIAFVGYVELSNIGSRDIDCKGTPFEVTDVNSVIETEIRPVLTKLALIENKSKSDVEEVLTMIKKIPLSIKEGQSVMQKTYEKLKQENFATYGKQGGCASLSSAFRTVVHQRKLAIKNFLKNR